MNTNTPPDISRQNQNPDDEFETPPLNPDAVIPPRRPLDEPDPIGSAPAPEDEPIGGSTSLRVLSLVVIVALVLTSGGALLATLNPGAIVLFAIAAVALGLVVIGWLWRRARAQSRPRTVGDLIETKGTLRGR